MIANFAVAINWNWRPDESEITRFKKQCLRTSGVSGRRDPISKRKLVVLFLVVGLVLCSWVVNLRPASAPIVSINGLNSPTMSINIQNFAFNPQNATIQIGDSVAWTNNDPVVYTLWFTNASDGSTYFLSPPINPGKTWTHTFPDKLQLNYYDFDRLYIIGKLVIVPILMVDFSPTRSVTTTVFFGASVSGGTAPYKLTWALGDGMNSTSNAPLHTYMSYGTYVVTLTVTDSSTQNALTAATTHPLTLTPTGGEGGGRALAK